MYSSDRMLRNALFGMFNDFGAGGPQQQHQQHHQQQQASQDPFSAMMMPFGFGGPLSMGAMMDPFQGLHAMMSGAGGMGGVGNGMSYCSTNVMSFTSDGHVVQQSSEVRQGQNGVRETKRSLQDTRSGQKELEVGHYLKDKAHIKKKSKNVYTGEEEQGEDFVNLEESEAEAFEQDWRQKASQAMQNTSAPNFYPNNQLQYGATSQRSRNSTNSNRLALASSAQEDQRHRDILPSPKRLLKSVLKKKKKSSKEHREARV